MRLQAARSAAINLDTFRAGAYPPDNPAALITYHEHLETLSHELTALDLLSGPGIDDQLAGTVGDHQAAQHLRELSAEARASITAIHDVMQLLNHDLQTLQTADNIAPTNGQHRDHGSGYDTVDDAHLVDLGARAISCRVRQAYLTTQVTHWPGWISTGWPPADLPALRWSTPTGRARPSGCPPDTADRE
jgi:hypothetical protein